MDALAYTRDDYIFECAMKNPTPTGLVFFFCCKILIRLFTTANLRIILCEQMLKNKADLLFSLHIFIYYNINIIDNIHNIC